LLLNVYLFYDLLDIRKIKLFSALCGAYYPDIIGWKLIDIAHSSDDLSFGGHNLTADNLMEIKFSFLFSWKHLCDGNNQRSPSIRFNLVDIAPLFKGEHPHIFM